MSDLSVRYHSGKVEEFPDDIRPFVGKLLSELRPFTVFMADHIVTFGNGKVAALDLFGVIADSKAATQDERNSLIILMILGDDADSVGAHYHVVEPWFEGFSVRFIA